VPRDDRDRAARLLLKALGSLSERERDLVVRMLLTGRLASLGGGGERRGQSIEAPLTLGQPKVGIQMARQVEQPLLVRLPAGLHARFRRWATAHGFSMAGVVRGLVERFLDEQEGSGRGRT
jgi:hypothetical protein